jgi:hypothetical protein
VTYALTGGNSDGRFAIDSDSGVITLNRATLNYEIAKTHTVRVTACDAMSVGGADVDASIFGWSARVEASGSSYAHTALCTSAFVTINVVNVNDQPVIMGRSVVARSVRKQPDGHVPSGGVHAARSGRRHAVLVHQRRRA